MPGPLRRSPLVALLLLLLTPGFGGWAVQALHPCPAAMPWTASAHGSDHDQGHHRDGPGDAGHENHCRCIGSCQAALVAGGPREPAIVDAPPPAFQLVLTRPADARLVMAAGRTPDYQPPATAPPSLS